MTLAMAMTLTMALTATMAMTAMPWKLFWLLVRGRSSWAQMRVAGPDPGLAAKRQGRILRLSHCQV